MAVHCSETHHAFWTMCVIKFLLLRFGFAFSSSLVTVLSSSIGRAWRSALPLDKHVQRDPSQMILIHTFYIKALDLKSKKKKKKS